MATDYYDDENVGPTGGNQTTEKPAEGSGDDQTFVLPKSIAGGKKVGDEITVKIVADHEDSYEVQAVASKPEEETPMEDEMPMKAHAADMGMY